MRQMVITFEDEDYDFDMDELTVRQGRVIKEKLGLTLRGIEEGLLEGDPDAFIAVFWVMKENSGEPTNIDTVDFKVMDFMRAISEAYEREMTRIKAEEEAAKSKRKSERAAAKKEVSGPRPESPASD